jgi:hypothetical protein
VTHHFRLLLPVLSWALALLAGHSQAHEFWLMPERFTAEPGDRIALGLRVGTGWPGEVLVRDGRRQVRFAWVDGQGEVSVGGRPGDDPAGTLQARTSGPAWAVYRSPPSFLVLDAEPFEAYLRDEGLEPVVEARRQRGQSQLPGREAYSRCAKSLVQIGLDPAGSPAGLVSRPLGLALELVPVDDPRRPAADGTIRVQLLFRGQPLAGALVKALPRAADGQRVLTRTDERGIATLRLAQPGVWLLNAVHMIPAPVALGADWESLWSSLTFEWQATR